MEKITFVKQLAFFIALFCAVNFGFGQNIYSNEINGTIATTTQPNLWNPFINGEVYGSINITASGIGRGIGIGGINANDRYNANSWNTVGIDLTAYFEFTLTPNAGYEINFSSFDYSGQASGTGPNSFAFRSSLDGYTTDIGSPTVSGTTINLSGAAYQNRTTAITFRIYGWGASGGSGTFSINDYIFNGTVSAIPCFVTTTWSTGAWDNGLPDINKNVVIADTYDTTTDGSFSACSLTINDNATLSISDTDYIEVENELTVEPLGFVNVQPYGSFVQNNDASINSVFGNIRVDKETAPMDAWYEYTYWSSPVSGVQIGTVLSDSPNDRRFKFNGQNFLDHCAETGNNNICDDNGGLGLQDDIDDDGNDWQWIAGTEVMQPGIGYATTVTEFAYSIAPGVSGKKFRFTFEGPFNNGPYTVPIYRNDSELNDNNWNFIGNPYPSAIDADLFLAANSAIAQDIDGVSYSGTGYIDGAIFLWSQDTDPSSTTNGNQVLNFSDTDYAIINASGELAGGDGIQPDRYIPSGQGFFVSMANPPTPATFFATDVYTADVVFNNSMRILNNGTNNNNSQFFKNTNTKGKTTTSSNNKLWVNLTSDNGIFNQILVSYINGATNDDDGISFDATKYPTKGAALYSIIEGSSKKFAIQGKNINSINEDEIINLGFKSTIDVPTLYKLSVAQLQGDFLSNNSIFLVDNLLNKVHDLSVCDYTFTSAVGEFNSRFEIAFTNKALSVNDVQLNTKAFKIVELQDDLVQFNTNNNLTIKTVNVYDLLGRELYRFKGENTSETYKLSNLNNTVYIAKVALSDGTVVTKKAVKK